MKKDILQFAQNSPRFFELMSEGFKKMNPPQISSGSGSTAYKQPLMDFLKELASSPKEDQQFSSFPAPNATKARLEDISENLDEMECTSQCLRQLVECMGAEYAPLVDTTFELLTQIATYKYSDTRVNALATFSLLIAACPTHEKKEELMKKIMEYTLKRLKFSLKIIDVQETAVIIEYFVR